MPPCPIRKFPLGSTGCSGRESSLPETAVGEAASLLRWRRVIRWKHGDGDDV
jgi:hypothetical protein